MHTESHLTAQFPELERHLDLEPGTLSTEPEPAKVTLVLNVQPLREILAAMATAISEFTAKLVHTLLDPNLSRLWPISRGAYRYKGRLNRRGRKAYKMAERRRLAMLQRYFEAERLAADLLARRAMVDPPTAKHPTVEDHDGPTGILPIIED